MLTKERINVYKEKDGKLLKFFSRYYYHSVGGVIVFSQPLDKLEGLFRFPPIIMLSKLLKFLQSQKVSCVLVVPQITVSW